MSRIKLVTLDLDNTLWDVDSIIVKAEQAMVTWLAEHVPDSLAHYHGDSLDDIRRQVFAEHQQHSHDLSFMRTQVLYEVMRRTGLTERDARQRALQAFDVFYEGRNRVQFFPGALDLLEALSRRFHLIALTNGNADIEKAGLGNFMHGAYSAADVGARKPHADMFHAPLKALDLKAEQSVHVGDHLIDDVQGASAVGMHTIWVNLNAQMRDARHTAPTREVARLSDVLAAVEALDSGV